MRTYEFADGLCIENQQKDFSDITNDTVAILTQTEFQQNETLKKYVSVASEMLKAVKLCKAEMNGNHIRGTFYIPSKKKEGNPNQFGYFIFKKLLVIIDNNGYIANLIDNNENVDWSRHKGIGGFLAELINILTKKETEYLMKTENKLECFEDEILADQFENATKRMLILRRQLLLHTHFYIQLSDVCAAFEENEYSFFTEKEVNEFKILRERMERMHNQAVMLREYSSQLRELCQSQLDMKQNKIMSTLTIVTTVFSPLSLIVGWYGMNFVNMPELKWRYGYAGIILFSVIITIGCLGIFKKKKLL